MLLRTPCRRQQVHKKRQNIKRKDNRYNPFKHRRNILLATNSSTEYNRKQDLSNDEDQLCPEGQAQDAVLAEMDAEALVFGADEDGGDDVAGHEEEEEAIVHSGVVDGVEDGEEDEADCAAYCEDYWE